MKRITLKAGIIALSIFLLFSCTLEAPLTVTIYNNTGYTTGTMTIIYGDYNGWADGETEVPNPTFPYTFSYTSSTKCPNYIVYATLETLPYTSATDIIVGYTFFNTSAGGTFEGSINMSLYLVQGVDAYEPDNTRETAGVIQSGEYQARSLTYLADVDYVSFYAIAGVSYEIQMSVAQYQNTRPALSLFDASGGLLAYDYNDSYEGEAAITWNASYTGIYYIMCDGYSSSYGPYGLTLSSSSPGGSLKSPLLKFTEWSRK